MIRSRTIQMGTALLFTVLLAACGSSEAALDAAGEELTGEHAGETAEEHAAHAAQDVVDQDGEAAAAETLASGDHDDEDHADHDDDDHAGDHADPDDDDHNDEAVIDAPDAIEEVVEVPAEEPAPGAGDPEADLQQLLPIFGVNDVDGATECINAEVEAVDMTLSELLNGDGLMVALFRCEREAVEVPMRAEFTSVDTSSMDATPEQIECSFDATLDYFASLELDETAGIFSGDAPDGAIQALVDNCDLSEADADFLLNDA